MVTKGLAGLNDQLRRFGLQQLGHCTTIATDDLPNQGTLMLIGPDEPSFWPIFTQSPEFRDDQPDPLDRWSRRILDQIATPFGAIPLFPFGGPPFQPIMTWALRSGRFWQSPIGFLVHDTAGLFVSFRGVLLVRDQIAPVKSENPCLACHDRPCLTACPVDAFTAGYNIDACKSHLTVSHGNDCMTHGCRSRRACPVGQGNRLPAQAAHHMRAFL